VRKQIPLAIVVVFLTLFSVLPAMAEEPSQIERTTVSGMRVFLEKNQSEIAEIALLLRSGSGLEPPDKRGIAAMMNTVVHWVLNDPHAKVGLIDINTTPDYILIRMTTLAREIKPALERIKRLLTEPSYDYDTVTDLKGLYQTEIKATPAFTRAYIDFTKAYYGDTHPYNDWPSRESILAITGADFYKYYRQTYQPGNAILSITGNVRQSISDLERFFSKMKNETVDLRLLVQPVLLKEDQRIEREDSNGKAVSICIGFSAPRIRDSDYPAFKIIEYYLNEYFHYFEELRVKEGLFYTPAIYYNCLEKPDAPNIVFLSMTEPGSTKKVEAETFKIVKRMIEEGIEQSEIERVLKAMEAGEKANSFVKDRAALHALSYSLGTQLVYFDKLWPKLKQVTTEDIKKVAAKYLQHHITVTFIPQKRATGF
jgi:predicted Zn-dependent peptidase